MNAPLSIGVIGAGTIAANIHVPVLRAMTNTRIAWIADSSGDRARSLAHAHGLPAIAIVGDSTELPTTDIILLATPLHARRVYMERFAREGRAVFAEKPLALDMAEHVAYSDMFDDWRLGCGYQRRHYATTRALRDVLHAGVFGKLREIDMSEGGRTGRAGPASYVDRPVSTGGGIVKNLGCHGLDLIAQLVQADELVVRERAIEWDGDTDREFIGTVELSTRTTAAPPVSLRWNLSWLRDLPNRIELVFDNARVVSPIHPSAHVELQAFDGTALGRIDVSRNGGAVTAAQAFYLEWMDFIAGYREKRASGMAARTSLGVARCMDAILDRRM